MGWRVAWIGLAGAALLAATPASAFCGGLSWVMLPLEFAQGSAALTPGLAGRVQAFVAERGEPGRVIDHFAVLASGDLGEGAEHDAASAEARAADKSLGEARLAAVRDALKDAGAPVTETTLRPTRQVFTAEAMARNPMLNPRVRAGVFVYLIEPRAPVKPGEPVPVC